MYFKEFELTFIQLIQRRWNLSDLSPILDLCTVLDACFKHLKFPDKTTRTDVLHIFQSNTESLMSNSDCTMADDVVLVSEESQETLHQEDLQDDMPAAKKAKNHKKSALDILLGPENNSEISIADEIEMYLHLFVILLFLNNGKLNKSWYPNIRSKTSQINVMHTSNINSSRGNFSSARITISLLETRKLR